MHSQTTEPVGKKTACGWLSWVIWVLQKPVHSGPELDLEPRTPVKDEQSRVIGDVITMLPVS